MRVRSVRSVCVAHLRHRLTRPHPAHRANHVRTTTPPRPHLVRTRRHHVRTRRHPARTHAGGFGSVRRVGRACGVCERVVANMGP
eukprot:6373284-Prymnesium_polylepis.1